jgi:DNA-binding NarL/FixJ family response regulator
MELVQVALRASDPLSRVGIASYLQSRREFVLLRGAERAEADVVVFSCDRLTAVVVAELRRSAAEIDSPVVLIIDAVTERELRIAVEYGVVAVLPRVAVTVERLADSVLAAAKCDGVMRPDLVAELLGHLESLQREVLTPKGLDASSLTPREIDVLRLVADGLNTKKIADELRYSERTVKNVIYGVIRRLNLRNRSHAVAFAVRAGRI